MVEVDPSELARTIRATKAGSIVAAAGCGKTEQIALTVKAGSGRTLVLTHTHAGKDALQQRLKKLSAPSSAYKLDTIAGWCLRYAASYPVTSDLKSSEPKTDTEWKKVYESADALIRSGIVNRVLEASYSCVLVDEYQDCGQLQHSVLTALSGVLPVCVFGDPLQAIFDFKGQEPVDWEHDVFPWFPRIQRLTKPWRWLKAANEDHADWLEGVRGALESGNGLNFSREIKTVKWHWLPNQDGPRSAAIRKVCLEKMGLDGRLVVIADSTNSNGRAEIAKKLAKQRFTSIEATNEKTLFGHAKAIDIAHDDARLGACLKFLDKCMLGVTKSAFQKAVNSRKTGGKLGTKLFGGLIDIGVQVDGPDGKDHVLELLQGFLNRDSTFPYRREMLTMMRSALNTVRCGDANSLVEALTSVQARSRHLGRVIYRRSVGSTLLVKGLEFEHVVIVASENMSVKDWYVALTRATKTVTILSPRRRFFPGS